MIIVTLMLLLILGAAYLQTARSDRMAFAPGPAEDAALSDKATAIIAIEDLLKKTLLDDLTNDNNSSLLSVADDDEIYDYPWTNGSASRTVFREAAPTTPVSSDGGTLDDTWLASTVPDISGPQPVWQHLTSLTGLYLRIPKAGNPSGYLTPWDDPGDDGENIIDNATASEWTWHDTDVAMLGADSLATSWTNWEPLGVDADQDGFPDSRWEWAPKRQINNTIFIMAVRIVDNSSMLNVNTMGAVTDGTNYSGDPVRGYFPSSLDASRLMSISKNGGG
ncbi:MAG: hypothetical protein QF785_13030, partial [Phycisphaeraceae bacterium]|nr:hypothetical protein [Phycisphaeraceae bacterium]